jgi:pyruvate formate lyase activating enzyme
MVKIGGLQKISVIDYPGKLACVVFLSGCNYNCGYCHNPGLVTGEKNKEIYSEEEIFDIIEERGYLDGIVISGGEPTLQQSLEYFIKNLKKKRGNLLVKLDTNGSDWTMLGKLKESGLADYVAMDVKGPPELYARIIGREFLDMRDGYEKAIAIVSQFPDYEFRTTIVPVDRDNGDFSFMTPEEIENTAKLIYDIVQNNECKYFLQPFVPHKQEEGGLLDSRFETFPETPLELLEEMKKRARKYLPNCEIRK